MKEIANNTQSRVFEINPRGDMITLALAHHPNTDEPEINVLISSVDGNTFLSRGVGAVVMARVMRDFANRMPTPAEVIAMNNSDRLEKLHEQILAEYDFPDVLAIWDAVKKFREEAGNDQAGKGLTIPHPKAESDVQDAIDLLAAPPAGGVQ